MKSEGNLRKKISEHLCVCIFCEETISGYNLASYQNLVLSLVRPRLHTIDYYNKSSKKIEAMIFCVFLIIATHEMIAYIMIYLVG